MLNCYFSKNELFDDEGSVEHINPENDDTISIGNLILLEVGINNEADEREYNDKIEFYKKSKYEWMKQFLDKNPTFSKSNINDRAIEIAELYYTKILGKSIE